MMKQIIPTVHFVFCAMSACFAQLSMTAGAVAIPVANATGGPAVKSAVSSIASASAPATATATAAAAANAIPQNRSLDLLRDADILVLRHANAPGFGDPPEFKLGDCATQRNLDAAGRAQATALGLAIKASGVLVGAVWTSQWCRTRETAQLLDVGAVHDVPAFNSFFAEMDQGNKQTNAARAQLLTAKHILSTKGLLIVVTHQVNIQALTGVSPAAGEGVALKVRKTKAGAGAGRALEVLGRVTL